MRSEVKGFFALILIGMIVFVIASTPVWVGYDVNYTTAEDAVYNHDLSMNITGFNNDVTFNIDTDKDVNWTNASGTYSVDYSAVSSWILITDENSGNLKINATEDNETGLFEFQIQATNTTDQLGSLAPFTFIVNATNDVPNFTNLNSGYDFTQDAQGVFTINADDEEEHYPLNFNLTFLNNCTHASWSGRGAGENCSIFNLTYDSNTSTIFNFTPIHDEVGTYWANFSVSDFNGTCPHAYCDASDYEENKTSGFYILEFNVYSTLTVNVSNCTGATVMEGESFNCTIEVNTRSEEDELNFSSYAFFSSNPAMSYDSSNRDWFHSVSTGNASNFSYSLPISVTPVKKEVGNWTINFSVLDVLMASTVVEPIEIFVNFTESNVSLDIISDKTFYENGNFTANGSDDDLWIWDSSVKEEVLTFSSNTSWVSPSSPGSSSHNYNYIISDVSVDYDYALSTYGEMNHSVRINVTGDVGDSAERIFVIGILNESAPEWNTSLDNPVVLELVEGENFVYNVSVNVSDSDVGDTISFYYENVSAEFCSLNASNFNSNGMINFTPVDCDVGYHDVTIIATDGMKNSSWSFNFSISNVADAPTINTLTGENNTGQSTLIESFNFVVNEGNVINFSLVIDDDDFLIPVGQKNYYNESLVINTTFTNSTGGFVDLFNFSFVEFEDPNPQSVFYNATFVPGVADVGNYIVFVNVSDAVGNFTNRTWNLSVVESLESPVLSQIDNASLTIHDYLNFSVNATDDEDDYTGSSLNYSIVALDSGAPDLTIGIVSGNVEFDMNSNVSCAGGWRYNVTVNDSDGMIDWQVFWVFIYGTASLVSPAEQSPFDLVENISSVLNFTINHSVGDNLTYEFWADDISCGFQNKSDCSYGNFSLKEISSSFGNGSIFGWDFLPDFSDETYGSLKNLTVKVYPNTTGLNLSQRESVATNFSFRLNISHTNAPMRKIADIGSHQGNYGTNINVDLSNGFADEDVDDSYYSQNVTFVKSDGHANIFVSHSSGWTVQVFTNLNSAFTGSISINGSDNFTSDVIANIPIEFTSPNIVTVPKKTTSTVVKFYSIRIIVPEDVIISDEGYIEVPFALENSGTMDLSGIDLASEVLYNNEFSDDIKIELGTTHINELKVGERKDYTMKIIADTSKAGRYKATLFADIFSPKFKDWGDFFIDLRKTNESEVEEMLIFTEKIIADNPECLELTEIFRRAQEAFEAGNEVEAMKLAQEVSEACEDAIMANEQIKYKVEGFVQRSFYYITFATLMIFVIGFIFYVYKRVRFNKSGEGKYTR
ncbi:hypothetical protein K8R30_03610 [archaeon]|nr:hypothetical protein [archaeon]